MVEPTPIPNAVSPEYTNSSVTRYSIAGSPPCPPYSSGTSRQMRPASPVRIQVSRSTYFCSAHFSWLGVISLAKNARA